MEVCSVCTGNPVSPGPCICGGVGTQQAELEGFIKELYYANEKNNELKHALQQLVYCKNYKDKVGKDDHYEECKSKAWEQAKRLIVSD